jgi:exosortase A-associated hydrolase 2
VRLGAALAATASARSALPPVARTVLWQPIFDGGRFLTQFLRLRMAASLTSGDGDRKETVSQLHSKLASAGLLEVAGYELSADLAAGLGQLTLPSSLPKTLGHVDWIEIARGENSAPPSGAASLVDRFRSAGNSIEVHMVQGEPFWSAVEVLRNPILIDTTARCLLGD